jgi:tRNA threonylcarbamoyl adenosine modification protein YeaZ
MSNLYLIIDTTIYGAAIGISRGFGNHCEYLEVSLEVADSARLLPLMVARGLDSVGCSIEDVDHICISPGPGSFTGIRVGLAYAFGLMSGLEGKGLTPKVLGISSLDAMARFLFNERSEELVVFLPATRTTGYASIVRGSIATLMPIDLDMPHLLETFPKSWIVLGDWPKLNEIAAPYHVNLENRYSLSEAARCAIGVMLNESKQSANWITSGDMPQPIYLRQSSVEEKAARESRV